MFSKSALLYVSAVTGRGMTICIRNIPLRNHVVVDLRGMVQLVRNFLRILFSFSDFLKFIYM